MGTDNLILMLCCDLSIGELLAIGTVEFATKPSLVALQTCRFCCDRRTVRRVPPGEAISSDHGSCHTASDTSGSVSVVGRLSHLDCETGRPR